ncbi:TRO, partial [Symbiodinium pilosum]
VNLMFLEPTAEPKPRTVCHVSSEAAYVLFLFWEQTAGRQKRPGPVPKAKLAEAVVPESRQLRALRQRINKLGEEHEEVKYAETKVVTRIVAQEVLEKIEAAPHEVTQEMFVRMIWPRIKSFDLKYVIGSFRRFFAQEGLARILAAVTHAKKGGEVVKVDMPASDLKFLFEVLDEDDDGTLSIKEMVQLGAMEVQDALLLSEYLDKQEDGEISLEELMTLVTGHAGDEFVDSLKGLFAATGMSA